MHGCAYVQSWVRIMALERSEGADMYVVCMYLQAPQQKQCCNTLLLLFCMYLGTEEDDLQLAPASHLQHSRHLLGDSRPGTGTAPLHRLDTAFPLL